MVREVPFSRSRIKLPFVVGNQTVESTSIVVDSEATVKTVFVLGWTIKSP